ncbi:MAG: PaaI family thioesterase [Actinomycetota bacterium]
MQPVTSFPSNPAELQSWFMEHGRERLPGLLGIEVVSLERGRCTLRLDVTLKHQASNGFLHAGTVVSLADTACGYGTVASLPDRAVGFTTIELKSSHTSSIREGGLVAIATLLHAGRTLQLWDASVIAEETGKTVGLFRNTQLMLY